MKEKRIALPSMLTPDDVAEILNLSIHTLAVWRCDGRGPRFHKVGRLVRYSVADVESYLEQAR